VKQQTRYLNYEEMESGLWYAKRMEVEGYRTWPDLPTRKTIFVVQFISANHDIDPSRFAVMIPQGVGVYDEQQQQRNQ
jgi:hypothetical protein